MGVNSCKGFNAVKEAPPLVRTPIDSQRFAPGKFSPKSSVTMKRPLVTPTSRFVSVPPTCPVFVLLLLYKAKVKS